MSSFFIALSLVLLCIIISKLFFLDTAGYFDAISCVITMSLFTFSPTFLLHGITASIYPMFAFLILIIYFLALEINYHLRMNFNILLLLCFLSGIILSFYPSIWFQIFIPVFVFMNFKKYYNFFNFCKFILLFLLGFSISLFLPFRTTEKEILILSYASSFKDFLKIFFKTEFFSYIKIFSFSEYFLTLLFFIYHLIRQATVFLIIFAIIGFFILIKVNKEITMLLVSISVFNTIIFAFLFKVPVEDYIYMERIWIPSFLIFFIFLGYGIAKILQSKHLIKKSIILTIILTLSFNSCFRHYFEIKEAGKITPYDYGKKILLSIGKDSILFINDIGFYYSLLYLQYVEKINMDIPVICCNYLNYNSYRKHLEKNKNIFVSIHQEEEKIPYTLKWGDFNWDLLLNLCNRVARDNKDKNIFLLSEGVFDFMRINKEQKILKINTQSVTFCKDEVILPIKEYKGKISKKKITIYSIIKKVISL